MNIRYRNVYYRDVSACATVLSIAPVRVHLPRPRQHVEEVPTPPAPHQLCDLDPDVEDVEEAPDAVSSPPLPPQLRDLDPLSEDNLPWEEETWAEQEGDSLL